MMKMEVTNISTFAKATIPHSATKGKEENILKILQENSIFQEKKNSTNV